ncbi:unnamed protein product [Trichobilharzia regenti]|nr:unnamed protein product [Trichobilharzia regenti]
MGVMVRLILVLAPIMCILGAIGISGILKSFSANLNAPESTVTKVPSKHVAANGYPSSTGTGKLSKYAIQDSTYPFKNAVATFMVLLLLIQLIFFGRHCIWVTSSSYSHPSIVLETSDNFGNRHILDDYREAYYWLRQNTKPVSFLQSSSFFSKVTITCVSDCEGDFIIDVLMDLTLSDFSDSEIDLLPGNNLVDLEYADDIVLLGKDAD